MVQPSMYWWVLRSAAPRTVSNAKCGLRFVAFDGIGPGGGGRTHTALRPPDFESGASASSATPGQQLKISCRRPVLKTPCRTAAGQLATINSASRSAAKRLLVKKRVSPTAAELSPTPSPPLSPPESPSPCPQKPDSFSAPLQVSTPPAKTLQD